MLDQLRIQNFALIEDWTVNFSNGESVITGETGSGKSLFVSALRYLCGERLAKEMRQDRSLDLRVEGLFRLTDASKDLCDLLSKADLSLEDGTLILCRSMDERGNKQWVNDRLVTRSFLLSLTPYLIDIHAQNAQSLLKDRSRYLPLLDRYVGEEADQLQADIQKGLQEMSRLHAALKEISMPEEELARQLDLLDYQIQEIEAMDLDQLDEEALNLEYRALMSAQERGTLARSAMLSLSDEGAGLRAGLHSLAETLQALAQKDHEAEELKDLAWQMEVEAQTLRKLCEEYQDRIVVDPQRSAEIDAIFAQLQKLRKKYGPSLDEVEQFYQEALQKRKALGNASQNRTHIEEQLAHLRTRLKEKAAMLTQARRQAADQLEAKIKRELQELAIPSVDFSVVFEAKKIGPTGGDQIDFLISTNQGRSQESMAQVASGGEMSRFMFAFKILIAEISAIPTLVFDEIDTGISGRTAQVVAEKMSALARHFQLIVITHLPQIAALADQQYKIDKRVRMGKAHSFIEPLNDRNRIEELSRMIGGAKITELTRKSAREMLEQSASLQK